MDSLQVAGGGGVEDVEPVRGIVVEVVPQLVHVLEPHVCVHVIEILTCKQFLRKTQIIPNLRLTHGHDYVVGSVACSLYLGICQEFDHLRNTQNMETLLKKNAFKTLTSML